MKATLGVFSLAGILLAGCGTTKPEQGDEAAGDHNLPKLEDGTALSADLPQTKEKSSELEPATHEPLNIVDLFPPEPAVSPNPPERGDAETTKGEDPDGASSKEGAKSSSLDKESPDPTDTSTSPIDLPSLPPATKPNPSDADPEKPEPPEPKADPEPAKPLPEEKNDAPSPDDAAGPNDPVAPVEPPANEPNSSGGDPNPTEDPEPKPDLALPERTEGNPEQPDAKDQDRSPLAELFRRKPSRSTVVFSEEEVGEEDPEGPRERKSIGFSSPTDSSPSSSAEPDRTIGFSDKPDLEPSELKEIIHQTLSRKDARWNYDALAFWLLRSEVNVKQGKEGTDITYDSVQSWLQGNLPEGAKLPDFTPRDYTLFKAWIESHGGEAAVRAQGPNDVPSYDALMDWLKRKPADAGTGDASSESKAEADYSKLMQWLRRSREP